MNLINQKRHQPAAQKNKAPAHLQGKMKTSTKGIYMFVSQKNKIIGSTYPDGDVLHIDTLFKAGRSAV